MNQLLPLQPRLVADPAPPLRSCAEERWSFVGCKKGQRWLWWVEDAATGQVVAFVFGRRTQATFRRLLAVLNTAGWPVERWFTDAWQAYGACLPAEQRPVCNPAMQRLARKTSCFSKKQFFHDGLITLFIFHFFFQLSTSSTHDQISGYWANSAKFGPYGAIWAGIQSGVAVVRTGFAVSQLEGFAKNGATGDGVVAPRTGNRVMGMMGAAMGLNVGTSGKLLDEQGLEVAGIVHKNEYVIPAWMRGDPQVLQVENWLEARRVRGYPRPRPPADLPSGPASTTTQLVQVLASPDQRLQGVEQWATQFEVVNDLIGLNQELDKVKKVQNSSAVESTEK